MTRICALTPTEVRVRGQKQLQSVCALPGAAVATRDHCIGQTVHRTTEGRPRMRARWVTDVHNLVSFDAQNRGIGRTVYAGAGRSVPLNIIHFISTRHQLIIYFTSYKRGSGASVTIHGMSGTDGQEPAGTDPTGLQLPRGAAGSSRVPTTEQSTPQSTAPATRLTDTKSLLQVIPYHGDNASFLGWKWSFLISASNQQTTL